MGGVLGVEVVAADQAGWLRVRRELALRRGELTDLAARLYPEATKLAHTRVLASARWLPERPVPLSNVELVYRSDAPEAPPVDPGVSERTRPLMAPGVRYATYSAAIRDLDPPSLFENRMSYRLLGVDWSHGRGRLEFGRTTYFDMIDVSEALAHETAQWLIDTAGAPDQDGLPLRRSIADPFDGTARALLAAVDTLTLRVAPDGTATFPLLHRDPRSVATAGRMVHVVPAGEFQPSSTHPPVVERDFDLWHNMMREYSEEMLGNPERHGGAHPIEYDSVEPFATMHRARERGRVRVFCLGVGQDALTLKTGIYSVALWDAATYDEVFAGLVRRTEEGVIEATAVPFTREAIDELLAGTTLVPGAAGCLYLAWTHRAALGLTGPE